MKTSIENLFVSFDLAKTLQEKEFDYGCIAWYDIKTEEFNVLGQEGDPYISKFHLTANVKEIIPAPMYQQVLSWFKEKHNLHLVIIPNNLQKDKWHYHRFNLLDSNKDSEPELVDKFNTEHEALIEGINQMLKRI